MNKLFRQTQSYRWLVIAALLLSACGAPQAPANNVSADSANSGAAAAPSQPAILRVGWPGAPDNLNPGMGELFEAYVIYGLVYDTLYTLQLDGSIKLTLAESVERSDDGKVYTFKIRQGVKFSDGQPLTAKDVAFSLQLYKDHADFPFMNGYTESFETVAATDDMTVVLTLNNAIPNLDSRLVPLFILPEHIWKEQAEGAKATEFQNLEMIGSGPYTLKEYTQNEFVRVIANKDHYWYKPQVDEIIFQSFGNEDALVQALVTGQIDMLTRMPNTALPVLKRTENVEVVAKPGLSPQLRDIIFNLATPEICPTDAGGECTGHPALRDRNVRLALAHATDKKTIIDTAMLGLAKPGLTLVAAGQTQWYNDQIKDYAFDIAKANQILDDAGYLDNDGDGVRESPDGKALNFRLQWPNNTPEAPRVAELLGQTWSQIGVKTEPQSVDSAALVEICCPAFDYDIMIWGWYWGPDPNDPLQVMHSDQIAGGGNESGYSNPEFDQLYDQQAIELDPVKRREMVFKLQEMVFNDVVYIIPYYPDNVQAYRTDHFSGWPTDTPTIELTDPSVLTNLQSIQ